MSSRKVGLTFQNSFDDASRHRLGIFHNNAPKADVNQRFTICSGFGHEILQRLAGLPSQIGVIQEPAVPPGNEYQHLPIFKLGIDKTADNNVLARDNGCVAPI